LTQVNVLSEEQDHFCSASQFFSKPVDAMLRCPLLETKCAKRHILLALDHRSQVVHQANEELMQRIGYTWCRANISGYHVASFYSQLPNPK
jgi:hypothetical protein